MHPNLGFDLLGAQLEACKEVGIKVPIYLTAGVNDVAADAHPEWREIGADGQYLGWTPSVLEPGFKKILIRPEPGGQLTWAHTSYRSVRGTVSTKWELDNGMLRLEVTVPANTRAVVQFPHRTEEVGSGTHCFEEPFD